MARIRRVNQGQSNRFDHDQLYDSTVSLNDGTQVGGVRQETGKGAICPGWA